ncbi:LysR family transcriptional regulator [Thalassomonas viridans]|uniref:LysR family transcriptional regulator n=1 Tax=Thalassomonas viridans TaxID=137584 RepID=A0AAE9Z9L7_9GAMM|nr:LysR substrate-binding domain-containing protein [Thalassomonas viridans]WDE08539.1 LysR family transcriptional regulator [Thalassomonas viridans]
MQRRPPPIQWVPYFEAVARHLSIKQAGEELGLSASAVSQKIKEMEAYMDCNLFAREKGRLSLTDTGRDYYFTALDIVSRHFSGYKRLIGEPHKDQSENVSITTLPFIANSILTPLAEEYQNTYLRYPINFHSSHRLVDLNNEEFDIAIRYGAGQWPGSNWIQIASGKLALVCSPDYMKTNPIKEIHDLYGKTFLNAIPQKNKILTDSFPELKPFVQEKTIIFDLMSEAIQASTMGHGLTFAPVIMIIDQLKSGKLLTPLGCFQPKGIHFWAGISNNSQHKKHVTWALSWIKSVMEQRERY